MNMTVAYTNGTQFVAEARGHKIVVDLPPEMNGGDTGPNPIELNVASLGSCMGLYVMMYLKNKKLPVEGLNVQLEYEKVESPARISKLSISIDLPEGIPAEEAKNVLKVAGQCPIHNTLTHSPEICVSIADRPEVCLP